MSLIEREVFARALGSKFKAEARMRRVKAKMILIN
jgi:hypothetical protein